MCVYVCVHVHVDGHVYVYLYVDVFVDVNVHVYVYEYGCGYAYMHLYKNIGSAKPVLCLIRSIGRVSDAPSRILASNPLLHQAVSRLMNRQAAICRAGNRG
jgi:hypothetical protein